MRVELLPDEAIVALLDEAIAIADPATHETLKDIFGEILRLRERCRELQKGLDYVIHQGLDGYKEQEERRQLARLTEKYGAPSTHSDRPSHSER